MDTVFVPCPTCGALGKVGQPCDFCGATIPHPKDTMSQTTATAFVVPSQTVSADAFATKISKFHRVEPWEDDLAIVSIGDLHGVINRNGDLVVPLYYKSIFLSKSYAIVDYDLYDFSDRVLYKGIIEDLNCEHIFIEDGFEGQVVISCWFSSYSNYRGNLIIYDKRLRKAIYTQKTKGVLPFVNKLDKLGGYEASTITLHCFVNQTGSFSNSFKECVCIVPDEYTFIMADGVTRLVLHAGDDVIALLKDASNASLEHQIQKKKDVDKDSQQYRTRVIIISILAGIALFLLTYWITGLF